jgi:hypothetical protein
MKPLILLFSLLLSTFGLNAQIQYAGCQGPIAGGFSYPVTLNPTGNVGARTTFTSGNLGSCSAGVCAFRIIWTGTAWEIQLSTDGGTSYTFILYRNTSASTPNPPDLTLGSWVDVSGVGCGPLAQLTGDVQSSLGGGAPEIDVTGNGNGIADGDITPTTTDGTDFGNVALAVGVPQTFVINNTGTAALNITSIVVSGAQAGDFVVSGAPTSVASGANANFTLTFTPSAVGARNATITINNDDADEGVYDFAVTGNGLGSPEIDVTGNGNGIADGDVTPSTVDGTDFGNVAVTTSSPQVFVIDNSAGTGTLTISSIVVSGANAGDFVVSGAPTSVAAGASSNFTLTFTPSAAGARNATVTINNDDADEGVYDFAVTGNGTVSPEIDVTGNGNGIADGDVTPSTVDGTDFGSVTVTTSSPQVFVIDNSAGTGTLTISSIVVSGANAGDFVVSGAPTSVAAGASANFTLTFTPAIGGTRNATVTINNDDADEGVYDFAVTGNGLGNPEISVRGNGNIILDGDISPTTVDGTDYGNVAISTSSPQVFVIDNSAGTGVLTISSIVVSGADAGDFVVSGAPTSVAAGASANFTLTFTPSAAGIRNATVTINNNDADEAVYDFAVRGNDIVVPSVAITEWLSNSLGPEPANEWVELYNYGATPVDLQNWVLRDDGLDNDVITTSSYVLEPGEYVILTRDKAAFENNWLACSNEAVLEIPLVLGNGADELIIEDNNGVVVWAVAYQNDETEGRSTYYTENTYTTRIWGSSAAPGVRRNGNDVTTGTLGYERNNATADPNVRTSINGDIASPFDGVYQLADIARGDALEFDGGNDFVSIPHHPNLQLSGGNFTIEYWAQPNPNGTFQWVVSKDFGNGDLDYLTGLNVNNQWRFIAQNLDIDITAGPVVTAGRWYHIACTFDGTIARLYINGIEVGIDNTLGTPVINTAPVLIGQRSGGQNFNGSIDELRIWNVARTATEIRENMHLTSTGCETGLVSYYQFNDGAGSSTLSDKTNNTNNGALINMDAATDWVASGVNTGDDAARASNSQTLAIPTGTSTRQANFANANLFMELVGNTNAEEYTVTYQAFAPNTITGAVGTTILQNPVWTINKQTAAPAPPMNFRFSYPAATFTNLDVTKYRLYWRPMYSDGNWRVIKNYAKAVTANTITFSNLYETGQFMVVQASEQLVSEVRGNMYDFDGVSKHIDATATATNLPQGNAPLTVEAWLKTTQNSIGNFVSWGRRASNNRAGFAVRNNRLAFIGQNNDRTANTIITDGQWHHVAITHDGTTMRFYVDGVLDLSTGITLNTLDQNLLLGVISLPGVGEFYEGSMDEVRIWGVARTQDQIRENMHLTLKGTETGLLTYYQFNSDAAVGTAGGVIDAMGAANGTALNMAATDYIPSEVAVAGGVSERVTVSGTGLVNFGVPKVAIDFGSSPNGEIVVSRLMTEKPHGWETVTGDVDNEYIVINNYGTNQSPDVNSMSFNEVSYLAPALPLTDINLYKRGSRDFGATWNTAVAPASSITPSSNGNVTFSGAPLTTGFSQFVIVQNNSSSLPVELVAFEAERNNRQEVQLRWTTAMELNNKGFAVERMLEGETEFTKVAYVEGQGTSSGQHSYYQIDPNSFTGVSYYRLQQIDFDGTVAYSPTRAVEGMANPDGTGMTVFPNPTQGALNFQILEPIAPQKVYITLTDAQGRIVREYQTTISHERIVQLPHLLENLSNNLYFLHVQTVDGKQQWSQKISLQ